MISSTFGAPLGGTTRGAHQGFESLAVSLITPPNSGGRGGNCCPSIVVVAAGEPGAGLSAACEATAMNAADNAALALSLFRSISFLFVRFSFSKLSFRKGANYRQAQPGPPHPPHAPQS